MIHLIKFVIVRKDILMMVQMEHVNHVHINVKLVLIMVIFV